MTKIQIMPAWKDVKPEGSYVYVHSISGIVFYVGMGVNKRAWESSRHKRSYLWIRKAKGNNIEVEIAQDKLTRNEAELLEMWLIAKFKHEGIMLCNITDGGDGCLGFPCSDEAKRKISISNGLPVNRSDGKRFLSASDAAKQLIAEGFKKALASVITVAANGKTESAYGYSWWRDGDSPKKYECRYDRASKTMGKAVIRSDGVTFQSLQKAANSVKDKYPKASPVNISKVAHGERPVAYGYGWSFM